MMSANRANLFAQNCIVSLGMYDFPEIQQATNSWWSVLARAYRRVGFKHFPTQPDRETDVYKAWLMPNLLLSQTCGYPFVSNLLGKVRLVATPTYSAKGCHGPFYSSPIIVRVDEVGEGLVEFRDRTFAFNEYHSHSGYNALRYKLAHIADGGNFFTSVIHAGGQRRSLELVAQGTADITVIDCVTWALLQRYRPSLTELLKVVDWTDAAPGLPLITSLTASDEAVERLREGLSIALNDLDGKWAREALLLTGAEVLADDDYLVIKEMADTASDLKYSEIR